MINEKAVILLSGGLDSTTVLASAKDEGYELYALSIRYGQRHQFELEAAKKIARYFNVAQHLVLDIDMRKIGGSALTDRIDVPKSQNIDSMEKNNIPITYVPARNTIFLSFALAWAEVLNACHIFIGANAVDYSGYPDCRPEYIEAFEKMSNLATRTGVAGKHISVHAPIIHLNKAEIIRKGVELGVDFTLTHSCYDPSRDGKACGSCDSCQLRKKGFREAGIQDPTMYQIF
ncbi:7-cyano-7-deazaguanine synthase QueC [candidate division KSB1 bacterium]|nr:7-cyano-7-deazaguanine synthase QueC [candidate division KSB1 bacterium]